MIHLQQLSKRILWVWRIRALCLAAAGFFLCGIAAVFSGAAAFFLGAVSALLFLLACVWYYPQRYRSSRWEITPQAAKLAVGVIFCYERTLPLSRVQYAELLRTPAQRLCGVCTLILHAAGAKLSIGGLSLSQGTELYRRINGRDTHEQS